MASEVRMGSLAFESTLTFYVGGSCGTGGSRIIDPI